MELQTDWLANTQCFNQLSLNYGLIYVTVIKWHRLLCWAHVRHIPPFDKINPGRQGSGILLQLVQCTKSIIGSVLKYKSIMYYVLVDIIFTWFIKLMKAVSILTGFYCVTGWFLLKLKYRNTWGCVLPFLYCYVQI